MTYIDARTRLENYYEDEMNTLYKHRKIKNYVGKKIELIPEWDYVKVTKKFLLNAPEGKVYQSARIKNLVSLEKKTFDYHMRHIFERSTHKTKRNKYARDESIKKDLRDLADIYKQVTGEDKHLDDNLQEAIEQKLHEIKESGKAYNMMLHLPENETYLAYRACWVQIIENGKWINQLIEFFYDLTKHQIMIDEEAFIKEGRFANVMDYFLFNSNGEVKSFVALNTLDDAYIPEGIKDVKVIEINNIKVLQQFFQEAYRLMKKECRGSQKHLQKLNQSLLGKFREDRAVAYPFRKFLDLQHYFEGESERPKKRIGVFLDNANIETNFYGFQSDFYRLINSIVYDQSEPQEIVTQVSTLFLPTKASREEQEQSDRKKHTRKRILMRDQFEVIEVENGKGIAHKKDDYVLIDKILESLEGLDKVLIFTGDVDFIDVFRKCRALGKELKIIATNQGSTAQEIIEEFGEELSYLHEYYECIGIRSWNKGR